MFNYHTALFNNVAQVMDKHKFEPHDIYNVDETGCTTAQNPGNVVAEQGLKQVGSVTSTERGELVTTLYTVSASGLVHPMKDGCQGRRMLLRAPSCEVSESH